MNIPFYEFTFYVENKLKFKGILTTMKCQEVNCTQYVVIGLPFCPIHLEKKLKLVIKQTNKGNSVFTIPTNDNTNSNIIFKKNTNIVPYDGKFMGIKEVNDRYGVNNTAPYVAHSLVKTNNFESLYVDSSLFRSIGSLINCSDNINQPNVELRNIGEILYIVATEDIQIDTELFFYYGSTYKLQQNGIQFYTKPINEIDIVNNYITNERHQKIFLYKIKNYLIEDVNFDLLYKCIEYPENNINNNEINNIENNNIIINNDNNNTNKYSKRNMTYNDKIIFNDEEQMNDYNTTNEIIYTNDNNNLNITLSHNYSCKQTKHYNRKHNINDEQNLYNTKQNSSSSSSYINNTSLERQSKSNINNTYQNDNNINNNTVNYFTTQNISLNNHLNINTTNTNEKNTEVNDIIINNIDSKNIDNDLINNNCNTQLHDFKNQHDESNNTNLSLHNNNTQKNTIMKEKKHENKKHTKYTLNNYYEKEQNIHTINNNNYNNYISTNNTNNEIIDLISDTEIIDLISDNET